MHKNIPFKLEQHLPDEFLKLIQAAGKLSDEMGLSLYLVGGAVRDLFLERPNFDLDLVVEGDAPELASQLAQREGGNIVVHRRFGTAKFRYNKSSIDFATARAETYAHPGALPTVHPSSINDDLRRRDFTINAMAIHLDPDSFGKLVDPYGGKHDLENKFIRILHEKSFTDDATCMLRAVRYEQRFCFRLEPATQVLLQKDLPMLNTISGDRIRHELELVLKEAYPEKVLRRASVLGMLKKIHPSLKAGGWLEEKFKKARSISSSPPVALYYSLLIYHLSQQDGESLVSLLRVPKTIAKVMRDTHCIKEILPSLATSEVLRSEIYHLLRSYSPLSIMACAIASDSTLIEERLHLYLNRLRYVKTSLDGEAIQKMGLSPGPRLGDTLRSLHDAKLDQRVKTREEEENMVSLLIKGQN